MSKPSQVIILIEDNHQRQLIQRYLKERGHKQHELRFQLSPSGRGSAENWVRINFTKQVSAYRHRRARAQTALIVMIDADALSVKGRLAQLDAALKDSGKPPVDLQNEQIARLIPKRNVETWILCLNGQTVDEEIDYKPQGGWNWRELIPGAANALVKLRNADTFPSLCTDSLRLGLAELRRIDL